MMFSADSRHSGTRVTGAASNSGSLTATETYPTSPTVTVTGTVSIGANGHMAGALQTSVPGQPSGSGSFESCTLAAVSCTASGTPCRSTRKMLL